MFDTLLQDHQRIRAIIAQLRSLLVADGVRIGMCFASARWALTRELLRHMAMEKQLIHDRRPNVIDAPVGSPNSAEGLELRYRAHIARWTATEIDARWTEYCRDLRDILTTLEKRMLFEEQAIFPQKS